MALITNDYFNQQSNTLGLKSSFTPPSEVLTVLIDEASEWVQAYCRRRFGAQSITDNVWGKGKRRLLLREYPVATVTAITAVDNAGAACSGDDLPLIADVRILDGGMLELIDVSMQWRPDWFFTITYTIPDPVPGPVKRATALKVVELMEPQYFPGKTKSVEIITNVQEQMVLLLEDYRRERLG